MHNIHLARQPLVLVSYIIHYPRFTIKVIIPRILSLAPFTRIAQGRDDETLKSFNGGCCIGNILTLLNLLVIADLIRRLAWHQQSLCSGIEERAPEISG